jgi:hypothetical protein
MENGCRNHCEGRTEGRWFVIFGEMCYGWSRSWEEDKEQEKSATGVSFIVRGQSGFHIIHDCEAGPLHPDLCDAEYTCEACEPTDFSAACEVRSTSWEDEYVGKGARSGRRSKQDEIWRQTERGTAVDDADVLREIGYEDADKDEARRPISGPISATAALFGSYSETAKLVEFGEDKTSQCVFITSITQLAGSTQAFVTIRAE